jgi:hypothetical protein
MWVNPHACTDAQGADIAPVWRDENLPDNLSLTIDDINRGLSFPDDMFDVIHVRMLIAGVRQSSPEQ